MGWGHLGVDGFGVAFDEGVNVVGVQSLIVQQSFCKKVELPPVSFKETERSLVRLVQKSGHLRIDHLSRARAEILTPAAETLVVGDHPQTDFLRHAQFPDHGFGDGGGTFQVVAGAAGDLVFAEDQLLCCPASHRHVHLRHELKPGKASTQDWPTETILGSNNG